MLVASLALAAEPTFEDGLEAYEAEQYDRALEIWTKLGEAGDHQSVYYLALMHLKGRGVPASHERGYELFHRAADMGNIYAQNNVGSLYVTGRDGHEQSFEKAFEWFLRAAERGHETAQYNLAGAYLDGRGVQADLVEGMKWLLLSAERGATFAPQYLEQYGPKLTEEQMAEARRRVAAWNAEHPEYAPESAAASPEAEKPSGS